LGRSVSVSVGVGRSGVGVGRSHGGNEKAERRRGAQVEKWELS